MNNNQNPRNIEFPQSLNNQGIYTTNFNKGIIERLMFPDDLGTSHRPNYVVIYINEVEGTAYFDNMQGRISVDQPVSYEANTGMRSAQQKDALETIGGLFVQGIRSPTGLGGSVVSKLGASHFKRLSSVIALPMPVQFSSPLNVLWSMNDSTNANAASAMFDATGGALARTLAETRGGPSQMRMVTNQAQESSFQNVTPRAFDMTWEMYPKSIQEAKAIWDIIQIIKAFMLPSLVASHGALKSPALFDFEFHHAGKRNDWLPRSTSCAVVNINVNYTMGQGFQGIDLSETVFDGFAKVINGSPSTGVSLTVSFNEVEILTRDRIDPKGDFNFNVGIAKEGSSKGIF